MVDIFNEVDEEVRRERLKRLWERYGIFVIALAVLIVIGIAGWRGYEWWQARRAAAAGTQFEHAVTLSEQGKQQQAEALFDKLAKEAPAGYRTLAKFRAAAGLVKAKPAEAAKAYDQLATDPTVSPTLQDLATVRAAMLQVDTVPFDQLERKLEPVAQPGRPFRATARELLALSAWGHKDYARAQHYIEAIMSDPETSPAMRSRTELLASMIAGTVKPASNKPAAKPAAPAAKPVAKPVTKPAAAGNGKS
ncbi:MAG TPA: tetratricopeptide repeat protein [Pseudolabrys sp.]|nr:tetratricopeptide repeat protein [Pseudolabrys sp.]